VPVVAIAVLPLLSINSLPPPEVSENLKPVCAVVIFVRAIYSTTLTNVAALQDRYASDVSVWVFHGRGKLMVILG
tara:strand:+ start:196 stop:420 length:225 start_codon:yes stop_codon:yes gene_type:complete